MKVKSIYIILIASAGVLLLWEQNKEKHTIWIQIIGIIIFFYGMMKLSAKTPSKNQENEE
jgi:uncharacterized membrane protein YbhN (UPF0104 family)